MHSIALRNLRRGLIVVVLTVIIIVSLLLSRIPLHAAEPSIIQPHFIPIPAIHPYYCMGGGGGDQLNRICDGGVVNS